MKILKRILLGIAVLIALLLITAIFVKKDYSVERQIIVNRPKQEVFNYVKYLDNQNHFNKWSMADPAMKKGLVGTDGTVGCKSTWESDEVGKGEQTIVKINEGQRVDFDLHFIKPFEGKADSFISTEEAAANETKVKWGFKSAMPYPFNVMRLFVNIEKIMGDDINTGLHTLKSNLESKATSSL